MKLRYIEGYDTATIVRWRNANAEFFPPQEPWTEKSHYNWYIRYLGDTSAFMYTVCLDDGTPVGTIGVTRELGNSYEIGNVLLGERELAPPGIMGEALEEVLRLHEADSWWLKVLRNNTRAIMFYKKHSFIAMETYGEWTYMVRVDDDTPVQA